MRIFYGQLIWSLLTVSVVRFKLAMVGDFDVDIACRINRVFQLYSDNLKYETGNEYGKQTQKDLKQLS